MTITFTKDGGTKVLSKDSDLIEILLNTGWKKKAAKKEVKNVKSSTTTD